jgi:ABC-type phosphate/phosphonate transport system substrate-binding protein
MLARTVTLILTFFLSISVSQAAGFTLAIQPILPQQEIKKNYQPLADYLSKTTGHTITKELFSSLHNP